MTLASKRHQQGPLVDVTDMIAGWLQKKYPDGTEKVGKSAGEARDEAWSELWPDFAPQTGKLIRIGFNACFSSACERIDQVFLHVKTGAAAGGAVNFDTSTAKFLQLPFADQRDFILARLILAGNDIDKTKALCRLAVDNNPLLQGRFDETWKALVDASKILQRIG